MRFVSLGLGAVLGVQLAAPPSLVAAELAEIEARGYLIVAVKDNWRPLGFRDRSGDIVGLEIDIARRLALDLFGDADAVELRPVSNSERLAAVIADQVDLAIAGVTRTPDRARVVNFSIPYYLNGIGLISRDRNLRLDDLAFARIAVLDGSAAIASLRYQLPQARLMSTTSYQEAKTLLEDSQADVFAGDATVLSGWIQEFPGFYLLPSLLSAEPLAVVTPKGQQYRSLHQLVDDSLNQWHETGWLEERTTYWGLP